MTPRRPKYDEVIDGRRVRVFGTRLGNEVLIGEGDFDAPGADVLIYPLGWPAQLVAYSAAAECREMLGGA